MAKLKHLSFRSPRELLSEKFHMDEDLLQALNEGVDFATAGTQITVANEAREIAGEIADKAVLDAALIAADQAVEHYEITRYGTLESWATDLGHGAAAELLTTTLKEEKAADKKLSTIGERKVNLKAVG